MADNNVDVRPSLGKMLLRGFIPNYEKITMPYVFEYMIIPYLKAGVFDILATICSYNPPGVSSGGRSRRPEGFNYNDLSKPNSKATTEIIKKPRWTDYQDLVFYPDPEKGETQVDVKKRVENDILHFWSIIDAHGQLRLSDLYQRYEMQRDNPMEENFGWTPAIFENHQIRLLSHGGVRLIMPQVVELTRR